MTTATSISLLDAALGQASVSNAFLILSGKAEAGGGVR